MDKSDVMKLIYPNPDGFGGRRFTKNSPVLVDVWIAYGENGPDTPQQLLLTPNARSSVQNLVQELRARLDDEGDRGTFVGYNESHVVADLTMEQLLRVALPVSVWWNDAMEKTGIANDVPGSLQVVLDAPDIEDLLLNPIRQFPSKQGALNGSLRSGVLDMIRIAGGLLIAAKSKGRIKAWDEKALRRAVKAVGQLLSKKEVRRRKEAGPPPLWSVALNRPAQTAVSTSRLAIKADAAIRLFEISCEDLVWAVIDSGIDARHPAFTKWPPIDKRMAGEECAKPSSRVLEILDFTRLLPLQRFVMRPDDPGIPQNLKEVFATLEEREDITEDLKDRLRTGRPLDWDLLKPVLRVAVDSDAVEPPNHHGTHVAGILGGDWRKLREGEQAPYKGYEPPAEDPVIGVCPDISLYDLRVIGAEGGSEFAILAALQFVRFLNMNKDRMMVHGVNLSFSLQHNVKSYGCGSTPVCQECERLSNSGVVVVAAAGNRGYTEDQDLFENYRDMSITDPGNAEAVITVGATHRLEPHRYGVSYFSSRGPTGDGRMKPDLVAPGEKITSAIPGNASVQLDGTSMAAPHVSGAAALLMARHKELIGRPQKVKQVLCSTATDLGRERSFQGAGMLDVLRAIQSV